MDSGKSCDWSLTRHSLTSHYIFSLLSDLDRIASAIIEAQREDNDEEDDE
jgi:hypothetical protein